MNLDIYSVLFFAQDYKEHNNLRNITWPAALTLQALDLAPDYKEHKNARQGGYREPWSENIICSACCIHSGV